MNKDIKAMMLEMKRNLSMIPEEFAEEKFNWNESTKEEIRMYQEEIIDNAIPTNDDTENQIWEQWYYRWYEVAIQDMKNILWLK